MHLKTLKVFCDVVGRKSFSRAASENGISQSRASQAVHQLEAALKEAGQTVDFTICEGADHAFFNDTRAEVYDEAHAATCWSRMLSFYREHVR